VRTDRTLLAALLFSTAVHLGVLLLWKGEGRIPVKDLPKQMVVRLLHQAEGSGRQEAQEEPQSPAAEESEEKAEFSLPTLRAGIGGGGVFSSRALLVHRQETTSSFEGRAEAGGGAVLPPRRYGVASKRPLPPEGILREPPQAADPLSEIRRLIEKKKSYPGLARRRGWEGKVVVEMQLDGAGALADLRVVEKSGYGVLDRATLSAVRRAAPFPTLPGKVRVPVSYRLGLE
jgi:protein TonB